jgi:hypothetical protein
MALIPKESDIEFAMDKEPVSHCNTAIVAHTDHSCAPECPVCFLQFDRYIHRPRVCTNGHAVCNDCRDHIDISKRLQCVICRSKSTMSTTKERTLIERRIRKKYFVIKPIQCAKDKKVVVEFVEGKTIDPWEALKRYDGDRPEACRRSILTSITQTITTILLVGRATRKAVSICYTKLLSMMERISFIKKDNDLREIFQHCSLFLQRFGTDETITVLSMPYHSWRSSSITWSCVQYHESETFLLPSNVKNKMMEVAQHLELIDKTHKLSFYPEMDRVTLWYLTPDGKKLEVEMNGLEASILLYVADQKDGIPLYPFMGEYDKPKQWLCTTIRRLISKGWLVIQQQYAGPQLCVTTAFDELGQPIELALPTSYLQEFQKYSPHQKFVVCRAVLSIIKKHGDDGCTEDDIHKQTGLLFIDVHRALKWCIDMEYIHIEKKGSITRYTYVW